MNTIPEDITAAAKRWESLRPEVQRFATLMEEALRRNEGKGGWHDDQPEELLLRAYEELGELHREVLRRFRSDEPGSWRNRIAREAADVANFALMVADVCGGLR